MVWLISDVQDAKFLKIWADMMKYLCQYFESKDLLEFWCVSPVSRERAWKRLMAPMRKTYWTFVETTIPANTRSDYSLYYNISGYTGYPYDINLRRYIKKRD